MEKHNILHDIQSNCKAFLTIRYRQIAPPERFIAYLNRLRYYAVSRDATANEVRSKNNFNYPQLQGSSSQMANEALWQQLLELDGPQTAHRANCQYSDNPKRYLITLLNSEYAVNLSDKQVLSTQDRSPAGFIEELCILAYLINSQNVPLASKLTPPQALPGGEFFFRGPHKLDTNKLEKTFGQNPERLYDVMDRFAAKRYKFGDAAIELFILPRIPLTIVIWRGDDEFPARASVLFDQTAASQLLLDALWAAVNLTIKKVIEAAQNL